MVGALWTGISGLAGQKTALDNESNNISNVNTIGYKSSRILFAEQITATSQSFKGEVGRGTQVLDSEKLFTQGNLKTTGVNYDVALSGDGFFAVSDKKASGSSETFYTRAGNFRMGDNGTLQDTVGNEVQGWPIGLPEVISSNPNTNKFTNEYTKLLSSKIIQNQNSIETITAKSTDYTLTAENDNPIVFSGAGLKTKFGKIADVEELIKAYTNALQALKNEPNISSSTSVSQISSINLPGSTGIGGTFDSGAIQSDGDEVFIYIDGTRISQPYIPGVTNAPLTAREDGYVKTMKAFADKISETPGLKAYVAENTSGDFLPSTDSNDVLQGVLRIESIVPGQAFSISSLGMVNGSVEKPGTFNTEVVANPGSGYGAVESIRDALNQAITGNQRDVYTINDLGALGAGNSFSYAFSIYSKNTESTLFLPNTNNLEDPGTQVPFTIANPANINSIVTAINANADFNQYIEAANINGSLVIRTLSTNFDVEFDGNLQRTATSVIPAPTTGVNAIGDLNKNSLFSGREGTGAEFIELTMKIDQTISRDSIQLRLDSLDISDNAFGDYDVDSSGLITMSQDGAQFAVGQISIARFITNRGLEPIGNNLYKATLASGDPIFTLNNENTAELRSNTLELSTADLSESLVNLMVFQRAFEANAKSITTADTILNTLIQLKR